MIQESPDRTEAGDSQDRGGSLRQTELIDVHAIGAHGAFEIRSYLFEPTGEILGYVLFVPNQLDLSRPVPLVVALHPAGAPPQSIVKPLAHAAAQRQLIVVAPMGYRPIGWYGFVRQVADAQEREVSRLSEIDVMHVLDLVQMEFNIDACRIYVAGASMGGTGAVHLASKFRNLFAAVAVISPAIPPDLPDVLTSFDALPLAVFHGAEDAKVPVKNVRDWVAVLKGRQASIAYHELEGGSHVSVMSQTGKEVIDFLVTHSRTAKPKST